MPPPVLSLFRAALCVLYHWQTLATGFLALGAGWWTVRATKKSADRQVVAAQGQTKAAQRQTAVTREIERRRIAREGYAFHAMLEAAMSAVIEDVKAARTLPSPGAGSDPYSAPAYAMRQRVKRAGFAELRTALVHFGGTQITQNFLRLDKEIEGFAGQFITSPSHMSPSAQIFLGVNEGLREQLDRIEQQAVTLRERAVGGMKLCREELANELINLEP